MVNTKIAFQGTFLVFLAFTNQNSWSQTQINMQGASFTGIYGGIAGGGMQTNANIASYSSTRVTSGLLVNEWALYNNFSNNYRANSGTGMLSLGAGKLLENNNFYFGAEGFATYANRKMNAGSTTQYNDSVQSINLQLPSRVNLKQNSFDFGGDIKLGHLFSETLTYFRIGVAFNKATLSSQNTLTYTDTSLSPTVTTTSYLNGNKSKNIAGLRLGVGAEYAATQKIHLNFDVIYTGYGAKLSYSKTGDTISPQDGLLNTNVVIPNGFSNTTNSSNLRNYAALVGLKYYFEN